MDDLGSNSKIHTFLLILRRETYTRTKNISYIQLKPVKIQKMDLVSSVSTLSSQITSHRTFDFREPDRKANRRDLRSYKTADVAPKMGGIGNQWHGWGRFRFVCSTPGKIGLLISIDLGSKSFKVYHVSGWQYFSSKHTVFILKNSYTYIYIYIYVYIYIICVYVSIYIYIHVEHRCPVLSFNVSMQ